MFPTFTLIIACSHPPQDGLHAGPQNRVHTGPQDGLHAGPQDRVHTGPQAGLQGGPKNCLVSMLVPRTVCTLVPSWSPGLFGQHAGPQAGPQDGLHSGPHDGLHTGPQHNAV